MVFPCVAMGYVIGHTLGRARFPSPLVLLKQLFLQSRGNVTMTTTMVIIERWRLKFGYVHAMMNYTGLRISTLSHLLLLSSSWILYSKVVYVCYVLIHDCFSSLDPIRRLTMLLKSSLVRTPTSSSSHTCAPPISPHPTHPSPWHTLGTLAIYLFPGRS